MLINRQSKGVRICQIKAGEFAIGCIALGIPMLTNSKIVRTIACVLVGALGVVSVILRAL